MAEEMFQKLKSDVFFYYYFLLASISIWLAGRLGGILFCFFLPFLRHGHLGGNFFWVFFSPTFPRKRVFFFFKKKES